MNRRVRNEICRVATICGLLMAGNLAGQTGPPVIQNPPANQSVFAGATANFTVTVTGMEPLSYQWFKQGSPTPIPGATSPTLVLPGVDEPDSGFYIVKVTNSLGVRTASASLMVTRVDFGDAPPPYPTLIANGGAVHAIVQGVYLGDGVSFEPDGQPDPNANSDTFDDGVTFCTALVRGSGCTVRVVASVNGYLDGWIDFNGNGVWEDPGERIFPSVPVMAGTNMLTFAVPASVPTTLTSTFARFRYSRNGGLPPGGFAPDGEVEDYRVNIFSVAADVCVNAAVFPEVIPPPMSGQGVLTVTNLGPSAAPNVIVSNNLPGVDILGVQGSAAGSCTVQGENIVCALGDMQPGESRMIQFSFHPIQPSLITNNVTARSDVFDPKPQNNHNTLVIRAAQPLLITSPPQSLRVLPGRTANFEVKAQGVGPLTYQWFLSGAALPDATNSMLVLMNVRNSGEVRVLVTDSLGSILSPPASLDVVYPPVIFDGPHPITDLPCSAPAQLAVQADGGPGAVLQYQWRLNGANIPGATNPVYEITNSMRMDGGSYTVAVASDGGVTVSAPALRTCSEIPVFQAADYFATRLSLAQVGMDPYQGVIQLSNCNATLEPGEPNHAGEVGGASIWFQWTAPAQGIATFDTVGSTFDTLLAVYTGTNIVSLQEVASDDDRGGYFRSRVQFCVDPGVPYAIALDGFAGKCGVAVLGWSVEQTAQRLPKIAVQPRSATAQLGSITMLSVSATAAAGTQLAYQWFHGDRALTSETSPVLTIQGVKTNSVGNYFVRVFGDFGRYVDSRPVVLEIGPDPSVQSHDKLEAVRDGSANGGSFLKMAASASFGSGPPQFVSVGFGIPGTQTMNNTNSTSDIDCFRIGSATRWLGIAVTNPGVLRVDTAGSAVATELGVYQFLAPSCLQLVVCMHTNLVGCDTNTGGGGSYSLIQFSPNVGAPYNGLYIVYVDGLASQGLININWQLGAPPMLDPPPGGCSVVFAPGDTATLSAGVTNSPSPPPTYQWYYYGAPLADATNSTLIFMPIQASNAGPYMVVVSNMFGVATNSCCVIVNPPLLHCFTSLTNSLFNISAALLPACVIQYATNLTPPINWINLVTNSITNCNFFFSAPMMETNGARYQQRYYRALGP